MKVSVFTLRKILEALCKKTGKNMDLSGLNDISERIDGIGGTYLYKDLLQKIKHKQDNETHNCRPGQLNSILEFLEYSSLQKFESSLSTSLDDQLVSLIGNYYNYVRANHKQGVVLRSPVRIYQNEGKLYYELIGKDHVYSGELQLRDGCLTVLMQSTSGKCFHHVYKIGKRKKPTVLQGIFSGMSTAFDPIGGRTVLIHQGTDFGKLSNRKETVEALASNSALEDVRLAVYFKEFHDNNISPNKSIDFGYGDLL